MNQTISMGNTPAIRASRALRYSNVRNLCNSARELAKRYAMAEAICSTVISYLGILISSEFITCLAASAALTFIHLYDSSKKGGKQ